MCHVETLNSKNLTSSKKIRRKLSTNTINRAQSPNKCKKSTTSSEQDGRKRQLEASKKSKSGKEDNSIIAGVGRKRRRLNPKTVIVNENDKNVLFSNLHPEGSDADLLNDWMMNLDPPSCGDDSLIEVPVPPKPTPPLICLDESM